jgi:hypothetical protein
MFRSTILVIVALGAFFDCPVFGGAIGMSLRNLDGTPIMDQANRVFTCVITTVQGMSLRIIRLPNGRVLSNDPRITLAFTAPEIDDPNRLTMTVTLDPGLFGASNNDAVVVEATLQNRNNPGPIRNVIGTADSRLHLAFPRFAQLQCADVRNPVFRNQCKFDGLGMTVQDPVYYRPQATNRMNTIGTDAQNLGSQHRIRTWTDLSGTRSADAAFVSADARIAVFKTNRGETVSTPIANLSLADQLLIKETITRRPSADTISATKN